MNRRFSSVVMTIRAPTPPSIYGRTNWLRTTLLMNASCQRGDSMFRLRSSFSDRDAVSVRNSVGLAASAKRARGCCLQLEFLEDRTLLSTWVPKGPAPVLNGSSGGDPASGRIAGIAGDPSDRNTIYIAAAGGGVWKTTDGGLRWTPLTD